MQDIYSSCVCFIYVLKDDDSLGHIAPNSVVLLRVVGHTDGPCLPGGSAQVSQ
jgi:hypothetical protein